MGIKLTNFTIWENDSLPQNKDSLYYQGFKETTCILKKLRKVISKTNFGTKQVGWIVERAFKMDCDVEIKFYTPIKSEGFVLYKSLGRIGTQLTGGRFNNDILCCRYDMYYMSFNKECGNHIFIEVYLSRYTKKGFIQQYVVHSSGDCVYEV